MDIHKETLQAVIQDTLDSCKENPFLSNSIAKTMLLTRTYQMKKNISFQKEIRSGEIRVVRERLIEAAINIHQQFKNKRIALLCPGSSYYPGGGVKDGIYGDEEQVCLLTTLYPCLKSENLEESYYCPHRIRRNHLGYDELIYLPNITVFKRDLFPPKLMKKNEFFFLDVMMCSAPDLKRFCTSPITFEQQYLIHYSRGEMMIKAALNHHVNILILNDFGCKSLMNSPEYVAKAYRDLLNIYGNYFDVVIFAISPYLETTYNFDIFQRIILKQ